MSGAGAFGWIALAAIVPLALTPAPVAARAPLSLALCSADGAQRSVELPAGRPRPPGEDPHRSCAMACHVAAVRRKGGLPA